MFQDICPIMSNGDVMVECTDKCAWFDLELKECAISRINGNLKNFETAVKQLTYISNGIEILDNTIEQSAKMITSSSDD